MAKLLGGLLKLFCTLRDGTEINVEVTYDPVTGLFPAQPLVATNSGTQTAHVLVSGPLGSQVVDIPSGGTTVSRVQLAAQGIASYADVVGFSLSTP